MSEAERVIIAGAGPVGLSAAIYLASRGVPVTVLEAGPQLGRDLRASTFHPPTLDMLDESGVTEQVIAQGLVASTWQIRDRVAGVVGEFNLSVLANETAHPYRVQCEQFKLTRIIYDKLAAYPWTQVIFNSRVTGASQTDDFVQVATEGPGESTETHRGSYLIGADGASSTVRKEIGVKFEGFTYPELFMLISTPFGFADYLPKLARINYFADPEEWLLLLRVPDFWRCLLPTSPDKSEEELLSDGSIESCLQKIAKSDKPYEIAHRTLYRVHQRVAVAYGKGRIFLVGDAAHINNPLGGMGMNGGIHDAFNLAEKIFSVLCKGTAPETLELYERQRRPIAIECIKAQSMENLAVLNETNSKKRKRQLDKVRRTADDPKRAYEYLMRTSMLSGLRKAAEVG
jgi:3-(3-hydroxy-phenyl)propionate hydroxylase